MENNSFLSVYIYTDIYTHNSIYTYGASLITHLVQNPPAMQETPVQFLGQEDTLEKG